MWAILTIHIDGHEVYTRSVWLTAGKGSSARANRLKTVEEHTNLIKARCRAMLETCDSYEIILHITSKLNEKEFQNKEHKKRRVGRPLQVDK